MCYVSIASFCFPVFVIVRVVFSVISLRGIMCVRCVLLPLPLVFSCVLICLIASSSFCIALVWPSDRLRGVNRPQPVQRVGETPKT